MTFGATKAKAKASSTRTRPLLALIKGRKARLSGEVSAPQDLSGCESNQTVLVQRKRPRQKAFATFAQTKTDAAGRFSIKRKIRKTFVYRAVLGETVACDDATSNRAKVRAKKK